MFYWDLFLRNQDGIKSAIVLIRAWCSYFDSNVPQICSQGSNWQYASIGSDNGLAPNRRQAIIWTNAGLVHWCIYVSLGFNELTTWCKGLSITVSIQFIDFKRSGVASATHRQNFVITACIWGCQHDRHQANYRQQKLPLRRHLHFIGTMPKCLVFLYQLSIHSRCLGIDSVLINVSV